MRCCDSRFGPFFLSPHTAVQSWVTRDSSLSHRPLPATPAAAVQLLPIYYACLHWPALWTCPIIFTVVPQWYRTAGRIPVWRSNSGTVVYYQPSSNKLFKLPPYSRIKFVTKIHIFVFFFGPEVSFFRAFTTPSAEGLLLMPMGWFRNDNIRITGTVGDTFWRSNSGTGVVLSTLHLYSAGSNPSSQATFQTSDDNRGVR